MKVAPDSSASFSTLKVCCPSLKSTVPLVKSSAVETVPLTGSSELNPLILPSSPSLTVYSGSVVPVPVISTEPFSPSSPNVKPFSVLLMIVSSVVALASTVLPLIVAVAPLSTVNSCPSSAPVTFASSPSVISPNSPSRAIGSSMPSILIGVSAAESSRAVSLPSSYLAMTVDLSSLTK